MKKILVIRFSSIGDIVLTTPVLRCLKKQYPQAAIHYATKKQYESLLINNPYVDKIHVLGDSITSLVSELKKEHFDFVVDLHNNLRTRIISTFLMVPTGRVKKLNFAKWILVRFKKNSLPEKHIVDRYFEAIPVKGVQNDRQGLDFFLPDKINFEELNLPFEKGIPYIAWVIGAKHSTKIFPQEKISAVCGQINRPVVLLGDANDTERGNSISDGLPHVFNAAGRFNLNTSAYLVQQAAVVLTNDTGLMHIAAAFKKKIISFWGNTVPQFGMYPYQPGSEGNYKIFEVNDLKCRPCSKLGFDKCPEMHFRCMNDIENDAILKLISEWSDTQRNH